jgi:hypothetical protein
VRGKCLLGQTSTVTSALRARGLDVREPGQREPLQRFWTTSIDIVDDQQVTSGPAKEADPRDVCALPSP